MSIALILPCAGQGSRAGSVPKQLQTLHNKPIFIHSLSAFIGAVDEIIIVCNAAIRADVTAQLQSFDIDATLVLGGETRMASVLAGLKAAQQHDFALIHDAARPNLCASVVQECIAALEAGHQAVLTAIPCTDTIKRQSNDGQLMTIDRNGIYLAQTPQGFPISHMIAHYQAGCENGHVFTDDISICEHVGMPITIINGHRDNIKYTYPEDLDLLRKLMA